MSEWAEHQFKLNRRGKDGTTEREHLEQVERQTGRRPKALEPPIEFPIALAHIWSAFISLSNTRSAGFNGPNPITYEQVKAWKELTETPFAPWEVDLIMKLDRTYLGVANG